MRGQSIDLVLFEDEQVLVAVKPAGQITHSSNSEGSFFCELSQARPKLFCLHRLDKESSGIVLFSKSRLANQFLTQQFEQKKIGKIYQCILSCRLQKNDCAVESYIVRAGPGVWKNSELGKKTDLALTKFKYVKVLGQSQFLYEARPLTGKTHQIRLHAKKMGAPLLGDKRYGGKLAQRLYLHASGISFYHPTGGKKLFFKSPPAWDVKS